MHIRKLSTVKAQRLSPNPPGYALKEQGVSAMSKGINSQEANCTSQVKGMSRPLCHSLSFPTLKQPETAL